MLYDIWSWTYHQHLTKGHHPNPSQPLPHVSKVPPRAPSHASSSRVGRSDSGGLDAQGYRGVSACGNEREELDSGDYSPGALRALAIAAEADERDAAIALVDAKKLAEQYEHQERTEARRAEERNLEAAKRLDETLQTELDREEEAAETAAAVAAVAAVEEAEAAAAATATPTRWPIAIDGLNICREESYHDPEFQYARYFYERLQRFGDTPRGRRRPALVKPLLATIQALEDLGYEPTIFLPRYALNPRHEDCIVGYEQIRGLLRRAEGAGASIRPSAAARAMTTACCWRGRSLTAPRSCRTIAMRPRRAKGARPPSGWRRM